MVTIKKPIFDKAVIDTLSKSLPYVNPDITAHIHIDDETIPVPYIVYYENKADYNKALTDETFIEFFINTSTYRDILVPNSNNLKMSIVYKVNRDNSNNNIYYMKVYNLLLTYVDKNLKESQRQFLTSNSLDATSLTYLRGQLVDPILYKIKPLITSGIYRNVKVSDVIYGVINKEFTKLNINYIHNLVPPDNNRVYDHIIVKSRTKVIKLPHYLQTGDYGVYNGGIGTYITQDTIDRYTLYNYPLLDYSKFNVGNRDRLIIYNPIKTNLGINDISHAEDISKKCNSTAYKDYKIVTPNVEILDKQDRKFIETFDTLYNVDPYKAFSYESVELSDNTVAFDTPNLTSLYQSSSNKSNVTNFLYTNMDDNLFKYRSLLVYNETVLAKITIPNVESTIFKPGMPVKYIYLKDNIAVELNGVLQSYYVIYNRIRKGNSVVLYVALEKGE